MKTVSITIPDELDSEAAAEARRRGISKSELFRLGLAAVISDRQHKAVDDPWHDLAGFGDEVLSVERGEIDETLYPA